MPKLSVVVVNYNVRDFLAQTLRTLRAATAALDAEVWVVDNASTDDSVEMVRHDFPEVCLVACDTNLGFAKANNLALAQCTGDVIALVNPDTLIRDDTFTVCLDYLESHPDAGMVGCKILNPDGTLQLACRRSFPTPGVALAKVLGLSALFPRSRRFGRYNLTYLDPEQEAEVEAISGSFMVLRRSVLDEVGLLDERFFMYGEDLDFCYRVHQAGWKIVYLPTTEIIHYKGQSAAQQGFRSLLTFYEAMGLFVEKHFHHGWIWLPQWLLLTGIGLRAGLSFVARALRPWMRPLLDVIVLQAALALAHLWRFDSLVHLRSYLPVDGLYTLVWLTSLALWGRYRTRHEAAYRILAGMGLGLVLNTSLTFFIPQYAFSRLVLAAMGVVGALGLLTIEGAVRLGRHRLARKGETPLRVLFAGSLPSQRRLAESWQGVSSPYRVVGFMDWEGEALLTSAIPPDQLLGSIEDAPRFLALHRVDQLIFPFEKTGARPILQAIQWQKVRHVVLKTTVPEGMPIGSQDWRDAQWGYPLAVLRFRIDEPLYRVLKRVMDWFLCLITALPVAVARLRLRRVETKTWDVSDGFTGGIRLRWPVSRPGPWLRWVLLWPLVLKGRMSWVGSALEPHADGSWGAGFRPGWTSPDCLSANDRGESLLNQYMTQYSPGLDLKLLAAGWKQPSKPVARM